MNSVEIYFDKCHLKKAILIYESKHFLWSYSFNGQSVLNESRSNLFSWICWQSFRITSSGKPIRRFWYTGLPTQRVYLMTSKVVLVQSVWWVVVEQWYSVLFGRAKRKRIFSISVWENRRAIYLVDGFHSLSHTKEFHKTSSLTWWLVRSHV